MHFFLIGENPKVQIVTITFLNIIIIFTIASPRSTPQADVSPSPIASCRNTSTFTEPEAHFRDVTLRHFNNMMQQLSLLPGSLSATSSVEDSQAEFILQEQHQPISSDLMATLNESDSDWNEFCRNVQERRKRKRDASTSRKSASPVPEGWHTRLNLHCGLRRRNGLPLYILIEVLYKESLISDMYKEMLLQGHKLRRQRKAYTVLNAKLFGLWNDHQENIISTESLLLQCAEVYTNFNARKFKPNPDDVRECELE